MKRGEKTDCANYNKSSHLKKTQRKTNILIFSVTLRPEKNSYKCFNAVCIINTYFLNFLSFM